MPSNPHPDEAGHRRGRHMEDWLMSGLSNFDAISMFCQPDAVAVIHGRLALVEAKAQDMFVAPPFDGHGLDIRQKDRYMTIYREHKINTLFIVRDEAGLWMQWIAALEAGPSHDLPGTIKTPRRIYPLTSFRHVIA